ncbi:MAG: SLC13 family permease, partial [bacterium]
MYVVFGIVILALFMFIYQPVPMDITAITVMVLLILLEPWTQISPAKGLSGFASPATITVLAMFILSEGIRKSGIIQKIGARIIEWTGDNISRQLSSIVGIVVPTSGMINNTAVVAILLPIVSDMARKTKTSPSKLLIPLSYASMFGGMLTLIGTSTNLLASDLSTRLLNRPIGMFEFTHVGIIVSLVGSAYLIWICPYILPERIKPEEDLTRQFDMENYLTEVIVVEGSTLIGKTAENAFSDEDVDADILRIVRGDNRIAVSLEGTEMQQGDILSVRTDRKTLLKLIELDGLQQASPPLVDETNPSKPEHKDGLVEVVIVPGSPLVGESMKSSTFRQRYNASVLALRHGEQIIHERMDERELEVGNTLLVQASPDTIKRLKNNNDFIVTQEIERPDFRTHKIPLAITITLGVIITASTGLLTILEAALSGVLAMVFTGCLKPGEVYDSVRWDIIFLLAGVIPLGLA